MMDILKQDWRTLRIAAFDSETTGLDPKTHRLVEFSIIVFEDGQPIEKFQRLINPQREIDPKAEAVHHISSEMLADKKPFKARAARIKEILDDCDVWCAFNETFDRNFLHHEFSRTELKLVDKPTLDPRILADHYWPTGPNTLDAVSQRLRLQPKQSTLDELGIDKNRHRADFDALLAGMALFAFAARLPKRLDHSLIVQDWMYRSWLVFTKGGQSKFVRELEPTLP